MSSINTVGCNLVVKLEDVALLKHQPQITPSHRLLERFLARTLKFNLL